MKKFLIIVLCCLFVPFTVFSFTACRDGKSSGAVNLVSVTAAEVGVRSDIDYYVVPEPAASTKVNAIQSLKFSGDLQQLCGGESGYPQAVVVAKNEIAGHYLSAVFTSALKSNAEWLMADGTSAETIVSAVQSHLTDGMTPTFTAKNLTKNVIKNCSVKCVDAWDCKEEVKSFMQKLNAVSSSSFGMPDDNFFVTDGNFGAVEYDGSVSVYAPDGAPALGLAKLMAENAELNGAQMQYRIVDATTIQTFVTGADPKADICVLPVNLAVKLLGNGQKYKMLATLTHGNLYMLSNGNKEITKDNISSLKGKTVGVINLAQVPGLTFKTILKDNGIDFKELT